MKEQLERQWRNVKKLKLFITLEGGEGTGKSTSAAMLRDKLELEGYSAYVTREPGGQGLAIAESIRKVIMDHGEIHPITELLLFNASRSEHVDKVINPKLAEDSIVISDRFADSTIVYQGIAKNVDVGTIIKANELGMQGTSPDLVFVFDLDPVEGRKRIHENRRDTNRFDTEGIEFHNKIRKGYLDLQQSNPEKYILIDASKTTEEIVDQIFNKIIEHENKSN